jgi:hypothetical protein
MWRDVAGGAMHRELKAGVKRDGDRRDGLSRVGGLSRHAGENRLVGVVRAMGPWDRIVAEHEDRRRFVFEEGRLVVEVRGHLVARFV